MRKANKCLAGLLTAASILAMLPTAASAASPDHIVINQIYGCGGKGDTPFSHSFIEESISSNRPRSLADGEWTENNYAPGGETEDPVEPQKPTQDYTLKTEGFENDNAV